MTVSSATNKLTYTGNGSTTVFPYTFPILDDDEIKVVLVNTTTHAATVKTKTTHYSVSGVGSSSGGNITMVTAPTSSEKLILVRNMTGTQEIDYEEYSSFPASTHEEALDRLTMGFQQHQEQLSRAITVPLNAQITDASLADDQIIANQLLKVNADADGIDTGAWNDVVDFTDVATGTPDSTDYLLYQDSGTGDLQKVTIETALNTATSSITAIANVGTGGEVYKGMSSLTAQLRTLLSANTDLTVTQNANDLTLTVADHYLRNDGDVGTGVYDLGDATSLEIPNSTAPSLSGTGQIALDTLVTDFTGGVLKYTTGGNTYGVLALPIAQFTSPTNNYVPVYNATSDQWEMAAQAGASGGTPGGATTNVQFNSSGIFGGDAGFTYSGSGVGTITARFNVGGNTTASGIVRILEDSDNGSNYIDLTVPSSLSTNYTFTLPEADCTVSAYGASIIDDADAAAARTTLGLGTIATQAANNVSISGGSVTGITDLVVADGGTGLSSTTAYAVLCGGTTSTAALQSIAGVGTSGQVLTSNGAGALPTFQTVSASPTGSVIQTVSTNLTTTTTASHTNGTGFADISGMSVSITPSSASNKVLIKIDLNHATSSISAPTIYKLLRGSTDIAVGTSVSSRNAVTFIGMPMPAGSSVTTVSFHFLDSPATTSSTTYKLQWTQKETGSSVTLCLNRSGTDTDSSAYSRTSSTITAFEIKG